MEFSFRWPYLLLLEFCEEFVWGLWAATTQGYYSSLAFPILLWTILSFQQYLFFSLCLTLLWPLYLGGSTQLDLYSWWLWQCVLQFFTRLWNLNLYTVMFCLRRRSTVLGEGYSPSDKFCVKLPGVLCYHCLDRLQKFLSSKISGLIGFDCQLDTT